MKLFKKLFAKKQSDAKTYLLKASELVTEILKKEYGNDIYVGISVYNATKQHELIDDTVAIYDYLPSIHFIHYNKKP